jgi:integration host factor subunit beta
MTRSELVDAVSRRQQVPRQTAEIAVTELFNTVREALLRGERVEIRGFGTFRAQRYEGYEGRNPRTGAPITVTAKILPKFKVGKELRERVNGEPEGRS